MLLKNLANLITGVGIILIFWLNLIVWNQNQSANPLIVFLLALGVCFSDLFDGWVARRWKIITPTGDFLDRARDKLFTCTLFLYLLKELWLREDEIWSALIKGLIVLILASEGFIALAVWLVGFIKRFDLTVHWTGKVKTDFYFLAIGWWFLVNWIEDLVNYLYPGLIILLVLGSLCGILSMVTYLQRYGSINN